MKLTWMYLLFVGVPLLGILGVLRVGQGLAPPASVAGTWSVEADLSALDRAPCANPLANMKQPALTISQSGKSLVLSFNDEGKTTVAGEIHGASLSGGAPHPSAPPSGGTPCRDRAAIYLVAKVDKQASRNRLTGELRLPGFASVPFVAIRHQPPGSGKGH